MSEFSYKKEVVDYFKKNLKKGYTIDSLKIALVKQGYSRSLIERGLEAANKELASKAPVLKERPVIRHEVFDRNDNPIVVKKSFFRRFFG